jgi:hypothetical protein
VNTLSVGTGIAVLVAGWPLYQLVTTGGMDATSAVVRGGIVAGGCAFGVSVVVKLALGYEAQAQVQRQRRFDQLYSNIEGAVADGTLPVQGDPAKNDAARKDPG